MEIDINELQLFLLPGKCPPKEHLETYLKAYHCWREVWEDAYKKELHVDKFLSSDDFTRQDEILALFHKGECTGMIFLKWVEAGEDPVIHDSYFKVWPEIAFRQLCSRGPNVIVSSQFTVHFKYRKNSSQIPWKDLLMGLVMERFRHSDQDAMTGTMRLQKNMGEATYRGGAVPLVRNVAYSSEEDRVDLVAAFQDTVTDSQVSGIPELVNIIFPKTIALVNPIIPIRKNDVKRAA